tara:strand:+ start:76 stop:570 length:495 start_codon:yes stop_codon:yes gene_type:complete
MAEQTNINRPAPYLEAAGEKYLDVAAQLAAKPVNVGAFAPSIAGQGPLNQASQQAAATQAGLGSLQFDPTTGAVTGVGTGTGVAGYQPFYKKHKTTWDHQPTKLLNLLTNKKLLVQHYPSLINKDKLLNNKLLTKLLALVHLVVDEKVLCNQNLCHRVYKIEHY